MKKILIIILVTALIFTGCSNETKTNEKLNIVTTIYPTYDWVKQIVGDSKNYEITLLGDNGIDLHSYQATSEDLVEISNADILIYVGGPNDNWINDAIKNATNKDLVAINLIEKLGTKALQEESIEGMTDDHDHDHDHDDTHTHDHDEHSDDHGHDHDDHSDDHDHDHDDHSDDHDHDHDDHSDDHDHDDTHTHNHVDEHIWLSLKNAKRLIPEIEEEIIDKDEKNEKEYKKNTAKYLEKLEKLDEKYENIIESSKLNTLLFADRFPFRYLIEDYNLKYYAAFSGCSSETEASFATIEYLSTKLKEEKFKYILVIENKNHKIPETIIKTSKEKNVKTLTLNSMQSITKKEMKDKDYLSIMEENLKVIEKALGNK